MKTLDRIVVSTTLVILAAIPLTASAASLSAGNMITAKMNQTIDSGSANAGENFTLTMVTPYPNNASVYAGAQLYGHITKVVRAGQGTNPVLQFAIDRIKLSNGRSAPVTLMLQAQETQKHNNATNIGVSTLAGMIVGNVIGKTVFKTSGGGIAGAIAGAIYASNRRTNVSLRQGSTVVLEVQRAVSI